LIDNGLFYDKIRLLGFARSALGADKKIDLMKLALEVSPDVELADGRRRTIES
jgi:hypothetical protein